MRCDGKGACPDKGKCFYDIRKSWTEKGFGLFPDQRRESIEKGCKLLNRTVSLTICEAIVKCKRADICDRVQWKYHRELYFDASLKIEMVNLRAVRKDTRDIFQDLQDVANGIEVVHISDTLKAAKRQKKARRDAAKASKVRRAEKMLLLHGWAELNEIWKQRIEKLLDDDRIEELLQRREMKEEQLSFFEMDSK